MTQPSKKSSLVLTLVVIAALGGMALLWKELAANRKVQDKLVTDQASVQREFLRMQEENQRLNEDLKTARDDLEEMRPLLKTFTDAADREFRGTEAEKLRMLARELTRRTAGNETAPRPAPKPREPEPPANQLVRTDTTIVPIENGYIANLGFKPTTGEPLDMLALIVRVPKGSTAEITGLTPVDDASLDKVQVRVDKSGKHAVLYATPTSASPLEIAVSVSEPTTATISGTCGIKTFEVEIGK